ncbi:unnamed protein product [Schistosoma curassoni]|uniref:Secreted protein n=1 Tax=Schistosoma curassoni TaxID=6186 RepID=A0A183K0J5_9TREM|nr:unnamed protein product [Schistosoma curassoni]
MYLHLRWLVKELMTRISFYFRLVRWMYLHLRVDTDSGTRSQYCSVQTPWLAVESRTRVSSFLRLVKWMYLYLRVDVHSGT